MKTKLKGPAINIISNANTVDQIITRPKANVKGESIDNISARLLNLSQKSKTPNVYT